MIQTELATIPLVDLVAQHKTLRDELDAAWQQVVSKAVFTSGQHTEAFERAFAEYCGTQHAVGLASGTAALALALEARGIGPGDEVITSPLTFFATAEGIHATGAVPVFVDIDPDTYCLTAEGVAQRISERTRAILPVHLYGHPAPMNELRALAQTHGLCLIEDAAQAHGARIADRRVGSWGDAGCFSFYPSKNLGAYGDAGMVVTDDTALAERVRMLRDHGRHESDQHMAWSGNHRMDDLQARILSVKLPLLESWTEARRAHAAGYTERLRDTALQLPGEVGDVYHVYHLYVVQAEERDALLKHLQGAGIGAAVHYRVPLHLQPACEALGYPSGSFPVAEQVASRVLSLPMFAELTSDQQDRVCEEIRAFYGK